MAHIKCRYYTYRCGYGDYAYCGMHCNDPRFGNGCEHFTDHRRTLEDGTQILNVSEICFNAYRSYIEFEGDYKRYEVDDYELHIPRRYIDMDCIEYLEIDGRVIVGDEPQTDCPWK